MNDVALKVSALVEKQADSARAHEVLVARPVKGPIDQAQIRRDLMKRFSKTIAYLAK